MLSLSNCAIGDFDNFDCSSFPISALAAPLAVPLVAPSPPPTPLPIHASVALSATPPVASPATLSATPPATPPVSPLAAPSPPPTPLPIHASVALPATPLVAPSPPPTPLPIHASVTLSATPPATLSTALSVTPPTTPLAVSPATPLVVSPATPLVVSPATPLVVSPVAPSSPPTTIPSSVFQLSPPPLSTPISTAFPTLPPGSRNCPIVIDSDDEGNGMNFINENHHLVPVKIEGSLEPRRLKRLRRGSRHRDPLSDQTASPPHTPLMDLSKFVVRKPHKLRKLRKTPITHPSTSTSISPPPPPSPSTFTSPPPPPPPSPSTFTSTSPPPSTSTSPPLSPSLNDVVPATPILDVNALGITVVPLTSSDVERKKRKAATAEKKHRQNELKDFATEAIDFNSFHTTIDKIQKTYGIGYGEPYPKKKARFPGDTREKLVIKAIDYIKHMVADLKWNTEPGALVSAKDVLESAASLRKSHLLEKPLYKNLTKRDYAKLADDEDLEDDDNE